MHESSFFDLIEGIQALGASSLPQAIQNEPPVRKTWNSFLLISVGPYSILLSCIQIQFSGN